MANILGETTLNEILLIEVDADPSVGAGTPAPAGSIATINDGSAMYRKNSSVDTDWILVSDNTTSILNSIAFGG